MTLVENANFILAVLTLLTQIAFVILVVFWATNTGKATTDFVGKNGLFLAFLLSFGAVLGSYFYSSIAGFPPCSLCWYQRVFLFPQVIILGLAAWKQDRMGAYYGLVLSGIGALIALYNTYLQMGGSSFIPCDASGSCSQRFVFEFGYITIPLMSLTTFAMLAYFQFQYLRHTNSKKSV